MPKGDPLTCTIYIDESGDAGVSKIRDEQSGGSSPFFCMGATVMRGASQIEMAKLLDELQEDFRKPKRWKHATDLSHPQKVHFAKRLASKRLRFYGIISNKHTLEGYKEQIDWDPHKFYNKCLSYLLEIIARDLARFGDSFIDPRIIVESRNHDYDALRRYLGKLKENPIYSQSKYLARINPFALVPKAKDEEDLLRIADFVSHSIYSCVNKTLDNFGNVETRYWQEMSSRFAADESGRILGSGLKCIHSLKQVNLEREVEQMFKSARAAPS